MIENDQYLKTTWCPALDKFELFCFLKVKSTPQRNAFPPLCLSSKLAQILTCYFIIIFVNIFILTQLKGF